VLDLGAAQGNLSLWRAELGYDVTWNDIRPELADYMALKRERGDIRYVPGDVFSLDPGGHGVMTTPNGAHFRNPLPRFSDCADPSVYESGQFKPNADGHIFLLHADEIVALAESAGLRVREMRLFANPLTTGFLGTSRLLPHLPRGVVRGIVRLTMQLPGPISRRLNTQMAVLFAKP